MNGNTVTPSGKTEEVEVGVHQQNSFFCEASLYGFWSLLKSVKTKKVISVLLMFSAIDDSRGFQWRRVQSRKYAESSEEVLFFWEHSQGQRQRAREGEPDRIEDNLPSSRGRYEGRGWCRTVVVVMTIFQGMGIRIIIVVKGCEGHKVVVIKECGVTIWVGGPEERARDRPDWTNPDTTQRLWKSSDVLTCRYWH